MTRTDAFLAEMRPQWDEGYRALCGGDVEPWAALWSTREPVTLFGAGGSATGTGDVRDVLEWVASRFAELVDEKVEIVAAGASGDLAYTVGFEHKTVSTPDGREATYTLRTTHVFRREDGVWKIAHRHGDHPPERGDLPV